MTDLFINLHIAGFKKSMTELLSIICLKNGWSATNADHVKQADGSDYGPNIGGWAVISLIACVEPKNGNLIEKR